MIGAAAPNGEINVKDLAALATALQELVARIGRDVANTPGPGRTRQFTEEFAQLRLRAVEAGSTVLKFTKGPSDKLDVELPEQTIADERFWEIVEAIREDERPDWATDLIAESAARLVRALREAAPCAALSGSVHDPVEIESGRIHVETWTSMRVRTDVHMMATGRLEKVDLRSHEFRVRDDVGHAIELKHVDNDAVAAQFVGRWVIATGEAVLASDRLVALNRVSIQLAEDPALGLDSNAIATLDQLLDSATGPDAEAGIALNDDEFQAFLEAARA